MLLQNLSILTEIDEASQKLKCSCDRIGHDCFTTVKVNEHTVNIPLSQCIGHIPFTLVSIPGHVP